MPLVGHISKALVRPGNSSNRMKDLQLMSNVLKAPARSSQKKGAVKELIYLKFRESYSKTKVIIDVIYNLV
jgi:hypothetical protein